MSEDLGIVAAQATLIRQLAEQLQAAEVEVDRLKEFVHVPPGAPSPWDEIADLKADVRRLQDSCGRGANVIADLRGAVLELEQREEIAINRAEVAEVDRDELERTLEAVAMAMAGFTHNQGEE